MDRQGSVRDGTWWVCWVYGAPVRDEATGAVEKWLVPSGAQRAGEEAVGEALKWDRVNGGLFEAWSHIDDRDSDLALDTFAAWRRAHEVRTRGA